MRIIEQSHEILSPFSRAKGAEMIKRIEVAGRTCYKSEDKMTEESASDFIGMIIRRGHHSVLEHESLQIRFITDRGVTHELVRHRIGIAFSQESTRYCNYKGGVTFILPVWSHKTLLGDFPDTQIEPPAIGDQDRLWWHSIKDSERFYTALLKKGWTPQQARAVLPNSLKTEIVVTANLREWRHIFSLRCAKAAHPQMRELMIPLLVDFMEHLPEVFYDIHMGVLNEG